MSSFQEFIDTFGLAIDPKYYKAMDVMKYFPEGKYTVTKIFAILEDKYKPEIMQDAIWFGFANRTLDACTDFGFFRYEAGYYYVDRDWKSAKLKNQNLEGAHKLIKS